MKTSVTKSDLIDFLKGFSILTIVCYHLFSQYMESMPHIIKTAANFGSSGVLIFFFCSGFGLYYSFLKKPISYKEFITKRLSKIYIPYIIFVLFASAFPFTYNGNDRLVALSSHIFLFKMFINKYESSFGAHLWFMSTIIQFYFIFYILTIVKNKLKNSLFIGVSILLHLIWVITLAHFGKEEDMVLIRFFIKYLFEFTLGMVAADIYLNKNITMKINKIILFGIVSFSICLVGLTGSNAVWRLFNDIPAFIGYGGLAILIYLAKIKMINKLILFISKFSFEWYLVHMFIFKVMFKLSSKTILSDVLIGSIAFGISLVVGYGYYYFIQKYIYKNLLTRKRFNQHA